MITGRLHTEQPNWSIALYTRGSYEVMNFVSGIILMNISLSETVASFVVLTRKLCEG